MIATLTALMILTSSPSLAFAAGIVHGNSIFTTIFFAICSLIVVALMVPALLFLLAHAEPRIISIQNRLLMLSRTPWMAGVHRGIVLTEEKATAETDMVRFQEIDHDKSGQTHSV